VWPTELAAKCEIDAPLGWIEFDLGAASSLCRTERKYVPLPRFPISWRDIAVVVDEGVTASDLVGACLQHGGTCLVKAEPFDVFRGEKLGVGKKSVAIRLEFSHPDRSLESAEVDGWVTTVLQGLKSAHGANLR
jgi:phenylalanyl-tRNA synthetase beta chain